MIQAPDHGFSRSRRRVLGMVVAAALVAVVLYLARPETVWEMLATSDPALLAVAAVFAGAALVMRGARLVALLPPGELRIFEGTIVAAAAQAAALFAPARVGELALPWLLRRVTGRDLAAGVGTLLAARALDMAGLGLWAGWAVLAIWGWTEPVALMVAAALVAPPLILPTTLRLVHRLAMRCLAPRGRRGRRWARRSRRLVDGVTGLQRRPLRLAAAVAASLAMWAFLWALAWFLLAAMGHRWPAAEVVAGSAAASSEQSAAGQRHRQSGDPRGGLDRRVHRPRSTGFGRRRHRSRQSFVGPGLRRDLRRCSVARDHQGETLATQVEPQGRKGRKDHQSFTAKTAKTAKNAKSIAKTIALLTHRTIATEWDTDAHGTARIFLKVGLRSPAGTDFVRCVDWIPVGL